MLDDIHEGSDGGSGRCLCLDASDTYLDFFRGDDVRDDDVPFRGDVRVRCGTELTDCLAFRVRVLERTGVLVRRLAGASSSLLTTM